MKPPAEFQVVPMDHARRMGLRPEGRPYDTRRERDGLLKAIEKCRKLRRPYKLVRDSLNPETAVVIWAAPLKSRKFQP